MSDKTPEQELAIANAKLEVATYEYDKLNSTFLDFVERSKDDALKMAHSNTLLNDNLKESIKLMNKMFDHFVSMHNDRTQTVGNDRLDLDEMFGNGRA